MKLLICDDHALFREGLRLVLARLSPDGEAELLEAEGFEAALRLVAEHEDLDLLLLDLDLPGTHGLDGLRSLRAGYPAVPVVVVSGSEAPADVRAALERGASGYIPKSSTSPVLLSALRLVLAGGVYVPPLVMEGEVPAAGTRRGALTARQREVLVLMGKGLTNKEIGRVLSIAEGTVKAHIAAILEALDVSNRTEAVAAMHELGLGDGE